MFLKLYNEYFQGDRSLNTFSLQFPSHADFRFVDLRYIDNIFILETLALHEALKKSANGTKYKFAEKRSDS